MPYTHHVVGMERRPFVSQVALMVVHEIPQALGLPECLTLRSIARARVHKLQYLRVTVFPVESSPVEMAPSLRPAACGATSSLRARVPPSSSFLLLVAASPEEPFHLLSQAKVARA